MCLAYQGCHNTIDGHTKLGSLADCELVLSKDFVEVVAVHSTLFNSFSIKDRPHDLLVPVKKGCPVLQPVVDEEEGLVSCSS